MKIQPRDIFNILGFVLLFLYLQYCHSNTQDIHNYGDLRTGVVHSDSIRPGFKIFTIAGSGSINHYHQYFPTVTINGINTIVGTIATTATKDTLDDDNLTAFIADSLQGDARLLNRKFSYKLKVPLTIERFRTDTLHEKQPPTKIKHWVIGPVVGYSYTPAGPQPYIGVGVTFKIFEF